jgi:pimeloyl-ACP methyl ester carboxylesterase
MKRQAAGRAAGASWGQRITAGLSAATLAAGLAACGSPQPGLAASAASAASAATASVTSAPAHVAATALGPVGYREVGSGPPLVLIMGYAGTMETWEPQLVDTLARRYRVLIFDNAGVGATTALPALTIDAMANQTSALIDALHLGRADVLGWSMGAMIAQALAVLQPGQVRRLVLRASFPGVGTVIPPQAKIDDLTNGNGLPVLFPADQPMAAAAFAAGAESYAVPEAASAAVISAQGRAALAWFHGTDPAGRETSRITVPTLVADGTEDQLDATANARTIVRLIPGAKLSLYPDAGHGFLFQEGTPFAVTVERFLSGAGRPASPAAIRAEFASGQAAVNAAGKTWIAQLRGLSPQGASSGIGDVGTGTPTAAQVDAVDQPFASALATRDDELLSAGATGTAGRAITAFVTADERLAIDILALPGLSGPTAGAWAATIKADGAAEQRAEAALRTALGLTHANSLFRQRRFRVELAEQLAEGLTVVGRQRREQVLGRPAAGVAHVVADRPAAVGQVQPDRAAVVRVGLAADQARLLERVDDGGDRAGDDAEVVGQLAHPQRLLAAGDDAQGAFLAGGEAERGQPLGLGAAEPPDLPLEQVRELDRVFVLHGLTLPGVRLILS